MGRVRADVRARTARAHALLVVVQSVVFVHLGALALDGRIGEGALTAALWGSLRLGSLAFLSSDDLRVDQGVISLDAVEEIEATALPWPTPSQLAHVQPLACLRARSASRPSGSPTRARTRRS